MTLYRYKAIGKEGEIEKGIIEAPSLTEFKTHLHNLGFSLIGYSRDFSFLVSKKPNTRILLEFFLHLEQFENAGIPLKESLEDLHHIQKSPHLKATLAHIITSLECGLLFSEALAKHPHIFDFIFVSLIATGEKTGKISVSYHHLVQHLKWVDEIQSQTLKALRYPLIMTTVLLGVIVTLLTVLVPELALFIQTASAEIPFSTRLLISFSNFPSHHLFSFLVCITFFLSFTMICLKYHPKGPSWKDHLLNQLPLIGSLRKMICLTRFFHIFSIMFESNIDVLQALQTAGKSFPPGQMLTALERVEFLIKEGQSLSTAFETVGVFPSMVVRMVRIGEQTSSLHKTLLHIKESFDLRLKRHVEHIVGFIEPLLILILGLVMAWIIYAIFFPLYNMLSQLDV